MKNGGGVVFLMGSSGGFSHSHVGTWCCTYLQNAKGKCQARMFSMREEAKKLKTEGADNVLEKSR